MGKLHTFRYCRCTAMVAKERKPEVINQVENGN
jgi:hypothetical protein